MRLPSIHFAGQRRGRRLTARRNTSRSSRIESLETRLAFAAQSALDVGLVTFEVDGRPSQAYVDQLAAGLTTTGTGEVAAWVDSQMMGGEAIQTAQSSSLIRLEAFQADSRFTGIRGQGFASVIIDTGIDLDHSFFGPDRDGNGIADRIVYQYDFAHNDENASDTQGHGSNVSGIVASQSAQYPGMAPSCNIIHLKVFADGSPQATSQAIESALQWVVRNARSYNVASVNMSLGSGNVSVATTTPWSDELSALENLNVITVAAAGNSFYTYRSVAGVSTLASSPSVVAVSATWDSNQGMVQWRDGAIDYSTSPDRVASFSQRHPSLTTVFAPGPMSTNANHTGGLVTMAGTSQAAPHVAGVATLMQQLAVERLGRRLTVAEFKSLLQSTGPVIVDGDDENDNVTNTGMRGRRLDVMELAEAILGRARPSGDRFESNDALSTATNLGTIGDRVEANLSIHAPNNEDYYRFTAATSGRFAGTVTFSHAAGDVEAALYDSSGRMIVESISGDDNEELSASVSAGQTYFVRVWGYAGATNSNYGIRLNVTGSVPVPSGDRFEANDSLAAATNLGSVGERTESNLSIHAANNDDYYRFTAATSGRFLGTVTFSHAAGDIDAALYSSLGWPIATSDSGDDNEELSAEVRAGETYIVRVWGYGGATNSNYGLRLTVGGSVSAPTGDRFEANDSLPTATNLGTIGERSEANLSIHTAGDVDFYRFTAAASAQFTGTVAFNHAAGDLGAALYDGGGNLVTWSLSGDDNEELIADLTAGQSYIVGIFGMMGAVNANYSLQLRMAGRAASPVTVVNGTLTIVGTEAADEVSILGTGVSGQYLVTFNGQTQTVDGVTRDMSIDLGGGDDRLRVNNAFVNGKIAIDAGAGHDRVELGQQQVVSTSTDLVVNLGDGNDILDGKRLFIGGNQAIDAGAGDDSATFNGFASPTFTLGTSAGRNVSIALGAGNDRCGVVYGFVVGAWSIDGGEGNDWSSVYGSACSGGVILSGGEGDDELIVDTNFINADVRLQGDSGADRLLFANGLGTQHGNLLGGDGVDSLVVRNQRALRLNLEGGEGGDGVEATGAMVDYFFASLGAGNDRLAISACNVAVEADFDGGFDRDTLVEIGNSIRGSRRVRNFELV